MTDFYKLNDQLKTIGEGHYEMPPIDRERYTDLEGEGLEGPFQTRSGKVVYYDPKEGKYYDRDSDMYLSHEEFQAYDQSKPDDYEITKMELPKGLKPSASAQAYMDQMDDAHAQIYGEGVELTTSLQQAYESILNRENDSLANPEVVESQAKTSELDEQQDSKDLQEEQVAPYDNSECSTDDEEEIVSEAPPLPTEKQRATTQRIKDRIAMRARSPEDQAYAKEKESTANMLKLVQEIGYDMAEVEDKIDQLSKVDNGDLHDQISTMMKAHDALRSALSRAMKIVPRYESIKNEASFGGRSMEDRVEYLFQTCMKDLENIDKIFEQGAFLEMSVEKLGGDISWFKDVRNALDNAYQAMEESHMGAVAHSQMKDESVDMSVQENQLTDIKKLAGL